MANSMESVAADILVRCRQQIHQKLPFLSPAIFYLQLVPNEKVKGLGTDGQYLYYDAESIIRQYQKSEKILMVSVLHNILHCVMRHFSHKSGRNDALYDCAADYEVYRLLCSLKAVPPAMQKNLKRNQSFLQFQQLYGSKTAETLYNIGSPDPVFHSLVPNIENLLWMDDHHYWTKHSQKSSDSMEELFYTWQQIQAQIMLSERAVGKKQGTLFGDFLINFAPDSESKVSYKDFLRRFACLREVTKIDLDTYDPIWYTLGLEMYEDIPLIEYNEVMEDRVIDEFVLALDTSGSCSGSVMKNFLKQTVKLIQDMEIGNRKINFKILQCDAKIQHEADIHSQEDFDSYMASFTGHGFGGTSFTPVFNRVAELIDNGELKNLRGLLYLSDGMGTFPEKPTSYETVFVMPIEDKNVNIPNWVTKVVVTDEELEEVAS